MEITREKLIDAGILALKRSLMVLPDDMLNALEYATRRESYPQARQALKILLDNARSVFKKKRIIIPDCMWLSPHYERKPWYECWSQLPCYSRERCSSIG